MEKEKSLSEELVEIDTTLAKLIFERARLLGKAASARKNKKIALADPRQEKRLWAVWKKELHDRLEHPGLVRELFFNLNALSYIQSEEQETGAYALVPNFRPLQAELPGPRESFYFRAQLFLAALSEGTVRLPHNPQAESVQELISALNSWQASIAREGTDLVVEGGAILQASEDSAFVGGEPFTFYVLLCLALMTPCQIRFVGSAHLRRVKIQKLCAFLPQLGARLTPVEPAGFSLPARLESSGMLPQEAVLPTDLPVEFLAALLLTASCFPQGLRLTFAADLRQHKKIETVFELLAKFGLTPQEELRGEQCSVFLAPARPVVPEAEPDCPLDVFFASALLLMPLACGGVFCLRGAWPQDTQGSNILEFLEEIGVQVSRTSSALVSSRQGGGSKVCLELGANMEFFPLALAGCLLRQQECTIVCDETQLSYSCGLELLDFLGAKYTCEAGRLVLPPQKLELPSAAWTSPSPEWTLAFALLALVCPGLRLNNPGQLLTYWPGFWNIFNSLPRPVLEKRKKKEVKSEYGKKGKRIRLN